MINDDEALAKAGRPVMVVLSNNGLRWKDNVVSERCGEPGGKSPLHWLPLKSNVCRLVDGSPHKSAGSGPEI